MADGQETHCCLHRLGLFTLALPGRWMDGCLALPPSQFPLCRDKDGTTSTQQAHMAQGGMMGKKGWWHVIGVAI